MTSHFATVESAILLIIFIGICVAIAGIFFAIGYFICKNVTEKYVPNNPLPYLPRMNEWRKIGKAEMEYSLVQEDGDNVGYNIQNMYIYDLYGRVSPVDGSKMYSSSIDGVLEYKVQIPTSVYMGPRRNYWRERGVAFNGIVEVGSRIKINGSKKHPKTSEFLLVKELDDPFWYIRWNDVGYALSKDKDSKIDRYTVFERQIPGGEWQYSLVPNGKVWENKPNVVQLPIHASSKNKIANQTMMVVSGIGSVDIHLN